MIVTPKDIGPEQTPPDSSAAPGECSPEETPFAETPGTAAVTTEAPGSQAHMIIDAHPEKYTDVIFTAIRTSGTECDFTAYSYSAGSWKTEFTCAGFIGKNGLAEGDKQEGDGKTPAGVYKLGRTFGILDRPAGAPADYIKVTGDMYWDSDVNSLYYNTPVSGSGMPASWNKAVSERLADHPGSYDYSVEICYNTDPVIAGKGSAIFLHCTKDNTVSTLGCVAIPKAYMEKVLALMGEKSCIAIAPDTYRLAEYLAEASDNDPFTPHKNTQIPEDFVYLTDLIPNAVADIRYFGTDNFMGRRAAGYEANVAISTKALAQALCIAAKQLFQDGYKLVIYDAYRPARAVADFIAWGQDPGDVAMKAYYYPDLAKEELFTYGYISSRSRHSRGSAVDLSIVHLDGTPVDMGGTFDFFGEISHHGAPGISDNAASNRAYLKSVMENAGLTALNSEWWHYYLKNEPYTETYFDFPVR